MKFFNILTATAVLLGTPASAQTSPSRFDLVCSGEKSRFQQNGSLANMSRVKTAWTERFAVDLEARLFCEQECSAPQRIFRIAPGELQLSPETAIGERDEILIDRVNGKFVRRHTLVNLGNPTSDFVDQYSGSCSVAPFTAFPRTKF